MREFAAVVAATAGGGGEGKDLCWRCVYTVESESLWREERGGHRGQKAKEKDQVTVPV